MPHQKELREPIRQVPLVDPVVRQPHQQGFQRIPGLPRSSVAPLSRFRRRRLLRLKIRAASPHSRIVMVAVGVAGQAGREARRCELGDGSER